MAIDGGRLQIRNRKPSEEETQPTKQAGFWREDKVGCLLSVASAVSEEDPCPQIPEVFVDPQRMRKISREIKGFCVSDEQEATGREKESQSRPGQPEMLVRNVIATREDVHAFGRPLAAAAWQRGFAAVPREAFVADGQAANWTVCRDHFSHYTPILDFIHAICYVFAGAVAERRLREGWPVYCQWAQWIWSGQVQRVIDGLRVRQQALGLPEKDESEESPRSKVAHALRYLENQKSRMRYDVYRRQRQIGRRVGRIGAVVAVGPVAPHGELAHPNRERPATPNTRVLMIGWSSQAQACGCVGLIRPNSVKNCPA